MNTSLTVINNYINTSAVVCADTMQQWPTQRNYHGSMLQDRVSVKIHLNDQRTATTHLEEY